MQAIQAQSIALSQNYDSKPSKIVTALAMKCENRNQ
jgi:hypothetical protein